MKWKGLLSANRGVFLDLVTYTADLDGASRDHLEKYVVKNISKSIQMIFCLACLKYILKK